MRAVELEQKGWMTHEMPRRVDEETDDDIAVGDGTA